VCALRARSCAGAFKLQLGGLCELLLVAREAADRAGQEALYEDSLRLLSGGNKQVRRVGWVQGAPGAAERRQLQHAPLVSTGIARDTAPAACTVAHHHRRWR
jgi:hypothetical protein